MKYVYDGIKEHEARLCFVGETIPIYQMSAYDIDKFVPVEKRLSKEEVEYNEKLSWDIKFLDLTLRTRNICKRNNIMTIGDLVKLTEEEFARFRNAGRLSVNNVVEALAKEGLSLRTNSAPEPVEIKYRLPREGSDYDSYAVSDV